MTAWNSDQCSKTNTLPTHYFHVTDSYEIAEERADNEELRTHRPKDIVWHDGLYYVIEGMD